MSAPAGPAPGTALIVGTGLIGASTALGLVANGWRVHLSDAHAESAARAADLGAGTTEPVDADAVDLVVVAVPPGVTASVVIDALERHRRAVVTDVAGVKGPVLRTVAAGPHAARFVGGHPMAGREVSGPAAARSDLFEGRTWVLTTDGASSDSIATVRGVVESLGAVVVEMSAAAHDRSVALVSHVPQLMASLTAARLDAALGDDVAIAGQGLRDVTRIAASDPALWGEVVRANAADVAPLLRAVRADLDAVLESLTEQRTDGTDPSVVDVVRRGNAGYARIPGKHGAAAQRYAQVPVVIPDEPGGLARLFEFVGDQGVNIEDLALEHSPGQPVGLATLSVRPEAADGLGDALRSAGWTVHR